jgi:hypothetical protein
MSARIRAGVRSSEEAELHDRSAPASTHWMIYILLQKVARDFELAGPTQSNEAWLPLWAWRCTQLDGIACRSVNKQSKHP